MKRIKSQDFYIARLHGRAELPSSIVLDELDHNELLSNQVYLDFLVHIFTNYSCLFIGFSFSDPAITHILQFIETRLSPNYPKMHSALLSSDTDDEFKDKLANFNINTIFYDPDYDHYALWQGIKLASREIPNALKREKPKPEFPLLPIQKFLATSYTKLKLSNKIQPLRDVVIDGMLLTLLRESPTKSISIEYGVNELHRLLKIPKEDSKVLLEQRIDFLLGEESIAYENDYIKLLSSKLANESAHDLTDDINILVRGVENRITVRHGGKVFPELTDAANKSIEAVLLARGWDLGASYVGAEEGSSLDITSTIKASVEKFSDNLLSSDKDNLYFSCFDLFQNPNE